MHVSVDMLSTSTNVMRRVPAFLAQVAVLNSCQVRSLPAESVSHGTKVLVALKVTCCGKRRCQPGMISNLTQNLYSQCTAE